MSPYIYYYAESCYVQCRYAEYRGAHKTASSIKIDSYLIFFRILVITLVGSIFAGYLLATALYSPGMLFGLDVGGSLTVSTDNSRVSSWASSWVSLMPALGSGLVLALRLARILYVQFE